MQLTAAGLSVTEIAGALGVSKSTVCWHQRKLDIPAQSRFARRYDWESIRAYYATGHSAKACWRRFGVSREAWSLAIARGAIIPRPRAEPLEQILVSGRRRNRSHVKLRLVSAGVKELRCERCGLAEWRGRALAVELHHVNGDGTDNRLENLELLCPNCHSLTDTWGAKNRVRRGAA